MNKPVQKFYSDAEEYWSKIPPTIDGMLGGFGHISQIDIQGSKVFLQQLFKSKNPPGRLYAADCGAGIGRISKHLLLHTFEKVDLVEQSSSFLDKAKEYIGSKLISKVGSFMPVSLQDFVPEPNKYDIIWAQWVLGHLTDAHFVRFLEDCTKGLKPNGMIIVKENITSSGQVEIDERDSSLTRPIQTLKVLFEISGLDCYRQTKQSSFPKELYNVYMFALRPKTVVKELSANLNNSSIPIQNPFSNSDVENVLKPSKIESETSVEDKFKEFDNL